MTTNSRIDDAVRAACVAAGFDSAPLSALHHHATPVYLLTTLGIVVRVDGSDNRERAHRAVRIARWARDHGVSVAEPAVDRCVEVGSMAVTFWRYYPQPSNSPKPSAAALGAILRSLHGLPQPSEDLPRYQPLTHLGAVLASPTHLAEHDRAWLEERRQRLLQEYAELGTALGVGLIHGDAYPGNTLWDDDRVLLGDWDEVATGPRELDLVNTHQGARMGRSSAERAAFSAAYGWDVTTWDGYGTLRAMRDLHTLAAFIQRGTDGDTLAANEVTHRIATLKADDITARWHSAS